MVQDLAETPSANIIFFLLFNEFHEIAVFNKFFEVAPTNLCLELNTLWVRIELTFKFLYHAYGGDFHLSHLVAKSGLRVFPPKSGILIIPRVRTVSTLFL